MAPRTSQSGPGDPGTESADSLPSVERALVSGERERVSRARALLDPCRACPVRCGTRRSEGERGACGAALAVPVSSAFPHFGEERPLSGHHGSGTVFFGGCNLHCIFCQNSDISQGDPEAQREVEPEDLSRLFLQMQERGCHNVNLVSPSHVGPQLVLALAHARRQGLRVPVVWNSGGYDEPELLGLLDGLVDIYMPDAKYWDPEVGERLSGVLDYPEVLRVALREMHRQVGDLALNEQGVATRGLLVRHLVLPEGLAGSEGVLGFLAELSRDTYVNIMGQYHPCHRHREDPRLGRAPTPGELQEAFDIAERVGLRRLDERPQRLWRLRLTD
ncbi:MAG: radical SAM protein [bacterium]